MTILHQISIKKWYAKQPQADKDRIPALLAGVGLGLVLAQSLIFMGRPVAGYIFIALALAVALLQGKKITLGPRWMYIPLLVIVGTVLVRTILLDVNIGTYEVGFISLMFCAYLAGRVCGRQLFFILPIIVITLSFLVYIDAVLRPGLPTGGIADPRNYNLSVAVLIMGTILTTWDRKWIVVFFALPAIFLTGASEGVVTFAVIAVMVLIRRDFSTKLLLPAGALSIAFLATFFAGTIDSLYNRANGIITQTAQSSAVSLRVDGYVYALSNINLLGHGLDPTNTVAAELSVTSIHNVPLRVMYEIGPIAAIAWCFAMLVGLFKTRYKYAFAAILTFSLFDHLMWTWLAPIPWLIAGVATVDNEGDYLFRKESI